MLTIGISGGSGSGKSTIVDQLLRRGDCMDSISFLPHDAYYLNPGDMPEEIRRTNNWDHPDALDNRLFLEHICALKAGQAVDRPVYDFATHSRSADTIRIEPRPVLLLEGILLFAAPEVREQIGLRVFVDTAADLRVLRRTLRDTVERGRTVQSTAEQYQATVRPMHHLFVEPSKAYAHVIIPWEIDNPEAVELLALRIQACSP